MWCLQKIGETDRVLEYSQKVYDIKKNDEDEYMMSGLFKIIEAYIDKEDYDLARKYCKIALASSIKIKINSMNIKHWDSMLICIKSEWSNSCNWISD